MKSGRSSCCSPRSANWFARETHGMAQNPSLSGRRGVRCRGAGSISGRRARLGLAPPPPGEARCPPAGRPRPRCRSPGWAGWVGRSGRTGTLLVRAGWPMTAASVDRWINGLRTVLAIRSLPLTPGRLIGPAAILRRDWSHSSTAVASQQMRPPAASLNEGGKCPPSISRLRCTRLYGMPRCRKSS
jgi:hypothetical protein